MWEWGGGGGAGWLEFLNHCLGLLSSFYGDISRADAGHCHDLMVSALFFKLGAFSHLGFSGTVSSPVIFRDYSMIPQLLLKVLPFPGLGFMGWET